MAGASRIPATLADGDEPRELTELKDEGSQLSIEYTEPIGP